MSALDHPHRRYNPLIGRWILVSAGRTRRPWQGQEEATPTDDRPAYDPDCYLCPGNVRASGDRNPAYDQTLVFTNDFAALRPDTPEKEAAPHSLLRAHTQPGTCRVLCFSPRHDLTLAQMSTTQIRPVIDLWAGQISELSKDYAWVQVFENRGETMGASNPHPHGQLWASTVLPDEPASEDRHQRDFLDENGVPLLVEYAEAEFKDGSRVVAENDDWLAVVPFWAIWPFEALVFPRRHIPRLPDLEANERASLASVLKRLLVQYDNVFHHPFPYSMGWHGAPGAAGGDAHWQLHAHFYPPLLRSATVRKFMVGYEMLADVQRDVTPEAAAEQLRAQPEMHYLEAITPDSRRT